MSDLLTTPFGFESTAADVIDGVDLTGKTTIVTGASSGIGVETARSLVAAGLRSRWPSGTKRQETASPVRSALAASR